MQLFTEKEKLCLINDLSCFQPCWSTLGLKTDFLHVWEKMQWNQIIINVKNHRPFYAAARGNLGLLPAFIASPPPS